MPHDRSATHLPHVRSLLALRQNRRTRRFAQLLGLVLVLTLGSPVLAQLSPTGSDFADALARAGWTGASNAGGVEVTARNAALCSAGMLDALNNADKLKPEAAQALRDIARVTFTEPGWFINVPVSAGRYSIGMERRNSDLWFTLHDSQGKRLTSSSFWIGTPTDQRPTCSAVNASGRVTLELNVGKIRFRWFYLSRRAHDVLIEKLEETQLGNLHLYSQIENKSTVRDLLSVAKTSRKVHESLLGQKFSKAPRHLFVFSTKEDYEAMDRLTTGGNFQANGAVTSHLTGHSYLWYRGVELPPTAVSRRLGLPRELYALVAHELSHQIVWQAIPDLRDHAPTYLIEGIAELAAYQTLKKAKLGPPQNESHLGRWKHAGISTLTPELTPFLENRLGGDLGVYYTACYLFVRELARSKRNFRGLLKALQDGPASHAGETTKKFLEEKYRGNATVYSKVKKLQSTKIESWVTLAGYSDPIGKNKIRLLSGRASAGMIILPEPATTVDLRTSFAYLVGRQADVYLCYQYDGKQVEFLKLSVLPDEVLLFHCKHDVWTTLSTQTLDPPLPIVTDGEPTWFSIRIQQLDGSLRLSIDKVAEFDFKVDPTILARGGRKGLGSYNAGVIFTDPRKQ